MTTANRDETSEGVEEHGAELERLRDLECASRALLPILSRATVTLPLNDTLEYFAARAMIEQSLIPSSLELPESEAA